jgi:hypothetical protein
MISIGMSSILQVPFLRKGDHLGIGKAAELVADHLQLFIQPGRAKGGTPRIVAHQRDQAGTGRGGVAAGDQLRRGIARGPVGQPQVRQACNLALAHGDAAPDLRQIFAKADLQDQHLHLAQPRLGRQPRGPAPQLAQRLDIGGKPGQRMGGRLMRFQCCGRNLAPGGHPRPQRIAPSLEQRLNLRKRRIGQCRQLCQNGRGGDGLAVVGHGDSPVLHLRRD